MIGNDEFVQIFGSVPAGDDEKLIAITSNAVRSGFAIVLNHPGEKRPMCILTAKQKSDADRKAQEEAAAIGDPMWQKRKHDCGWHHALTVASLTGTEEVPEGDPSKVRAKVSAIIRRLTKANGGVQPNIGVELGRSNMLVVDVDTMAEWEGFNTDWLSHNPPDELITCPGMTVESPGKQNKDGEWVHKHGGHYWFSVPEGVELPIGIGALAAESGWVAMWSNHQVLVPPSTRAEGAYKIIGSFGGPAPQWIIDKICSEAKARMDRAVSRGPLPDGTGDIDQWAAGTPWADLLEPDGWINTGLPDRCSCPIWTAPGPHGSPKSATAHDLGCDKYDTSPGHAPLHVWTDNPPAWMSVAGTKTFTKPGYVAWRDHEGNMPLALKALGFNQSPANVLEAWSPPPMPLEPAQPVVAGLFGTAGAGSDSEPGEDGTEPVTEAEVGISEPEEDDDSWKSIRLYDRDDEEEEPPTLMPRSDGETCLLYRGLIHSIHGESESGKSWIVQAEVVRLIKAGEEVLFLDFENDWKRVLRRFKALGATNEELKRVDYRNPDAKPDTAGKWWISMFMGKYALIVLDGVTDALGLFSLGSKDNDEISTFLRKFPRTLARRSGAGVVLIDHVVKSTTERGRFALGGQAKMAGLDGAAYMIDVVEPLGRGLKGVLRVRVGKDKPGFVRGKALGYDKDRLGDVARFCMDATNPDAITTCLEPPEDMFAVPAAPEGFDPELETKILTVLTTEEMGFPSLNKLIDALKIGVRRETLIAVIDSLTEEGMILKGLPDGRKAQRHQITPAGLERLKTLGK
jgi:hypothetical protein